MFSEKLGCVGRFIFLRRYINVFMYFNSFKHFNKPVLKLSLIRCINETESACNILENIYCTLVELDKILKFVIHIVMNDINKVLNFINKDYLY